MSGKSDIRLLDTSLVNVFLSWASNNFYNLTLPEVTKQKLWELNIAWVDWVEILAENLGGKSYLS